LDVAKTSLQENTSCEMKSATFEGRNKNECVKK